MGYCFKVGVKAIGPRKISSALGSVALYKFSGSLILVLVLSETFFCINHVMLPVSYLLFPLFSVTQPMVARLAA